MQDRASAMTKGPVAQWIRRRSTEPEIVGSSPTRVIFKGKISVIAKVFFPSVGVSAYGWCRDCLMRARQKISMGNIASPCGVMDNALDF